MSKATFINGWLEQATRSAHRDVKNLKRLLSEKPGALSGVAADILNELLESLDFDSQLAACEEAWVRHTTGG